MEVHTDIYLGLCGLGRETEKWEVFPIGSRHLRAYKASTNKVLSLSPSCNSVVWALTYPPGETRLSKLSLLLVKQVTLPIIPTCRQESKMQNLTQRSPWQNFDLNPDPHESCSGCHTSLSIQGRFFILFYFFVQPSSLCFLVPCFGVIISSRKFSWEFFFSSRLKEWRGRKKNHYHRALETSLTITTTKAGFSVGILLTNGVRKTFKHLQPPTPFVNPREETWAKK